MKFSISSIDSLIIYFGDVISKEIIEYTLKPNFKAQQYELGILKAVNEIIATMKGEYVNKNISKNKQENSSFFSIPGFKKAALATLILIVFFMIIEWLGRENQYAIEKFLLKKPRIIRWSFYGFIILLIGLFLQTHESPFIYFQF